MSKFINDNVRVFIAFVICGFLCACEPQAVRDGRSLWKQYYKKMLKDPDSFKVYSEKYVEKENSEVEWTLDIGAKNGMGGMVRETEHITTVGSTYLTIDGNTIYYWDLE